jgi:hypothetical protein
LLWIYKSIFTLIWLINYSQRLAQFGAKIYQIPSLKNFRNFRKREEKVKNIFLIKDNW